MKLFCRYSILILLFVFAAGFFSFSPPAIAGGRLIKATNPSVYYLASDGKRYVFPNEKTYRSWYADFLSVQTVSDADLATYPIGGNVTYRPGTRLVKITTDPKVYAVSRGGTLRWVTTEAIARTLFGSDWAYRVDDVPDAFFVNYRVGDAITASSQYVPTTEYQNTVTIDDDHSTAVVIVPTPTPTPTAPAGQAKTIRVYVAGESIERRNRYTEAPFLATGRLNDPTNNDDDQYGWMVPMSDRLHLRDANLTMSFVGASGWANAEDEPYSGTYPSATVGRTSAISGTSIESWLDQRRGELQNKAFCYDVAFASRGGNDMDVDDTTYQTQLKELIQLLARGSSCRTNPIVYVTGHMPDSQASVSIERHRFMERALDAVTQLQAEQPSLRVRFIDLFSPFIANQPTTAFPSPRWTSGGQQDMSVIGRIGDGLHPRRFASIYAGELAADAMSLSELSGM